MELECECSECGHDFYVEVDRDGYADGLWEPCPKCGHTPSPQSEGHFTYDGGASVREEHAAERRQMGLINF